MKADEALKQLPDATVYYTYGAGLFSKFQIRKRLEKVHKELPRTVVFGDDPDLLEKSECGGLIPEPRLVVIEDYPETRNKKQLFELINRAAEGSVFLLQGDKKEKITVQKPVIEIDCASSKTSEREFNAIIKGWLKSSSVQISDSILKRIFNVTGGDLFYAYNEVKKIALYAEATNSAHLSMGEVNSIMGPRIETDPFAFSTHYLQKNKRAALHEVSLWKQYDTMLHLYNHFKAIEKALLVKECKERGMGTEQIYAESGVSQWYIRSVFADIGSKWSTQELIDALKDCARAIEKSKKIANLAIPVIVESVLRRI